MLCNKFYRRHFSDEFCYTRAERVLDETYTYFFMIRQIYKEFNFFHYTLIETKRSSWSVYDCII